MATAWETAQQWEGSWWGKCLNTYNEERKQIDYMARLGYAAFVHEEHTPAYNFLGRSVLDIGGGPCSVLLKGFDFKRGTVVDPCQFPTWVTLRYGEAGIAHQRVRAEDFVRSGDPFDEGLMYNVLQHTENPEAVVQVLKDNCRMIRVFEWINTEVNIGHPNSFTKEQLDELFGGSGATEQMEQTMAYYGAFLGDPK